ncbi:MAG TPA: alpha/beta hydrolase [Candidatus Limnocylindrales bacterium]|nr:alpha/beta hydrolase [Candidatus Limnocylindrales bacterium]
MRTSARLHDGSSIDIEVTGNGPNLLLPVNPIPIQGDQAEAMRQWGADPALGRNLIDGLADMARVIAFDYEGHVMAHPMPETLTPRNLTGDFLAVADAAGADRFAYYGYSWLGLSGVQLASATDRLTGLALGGWPPIDAPYKDMLKVTTAGWELATGQRHSQKEDAWADASLPPDQARQFLTLYQHLENFDDRAAEAAIGPGVEKVAIVGEKDEIQYGPTWGDVFVSLAAPTIRARSELEARGWDVHVLEGLDHTTAMLPGAVLPILRSWLERIAR